MTSGRGRQPRAITIAGSDSGGGAGIQADLKVFQALGVFGTAAVTAITAQNTRGVTGAWPVPPEVIAAQIDAVLSDIEVDAAKTGMLHSPPVVEAVAEALARHPVPHLVVDPVIVAKDGSALLDEQGVESLKSKLLPMAAVVTPNTIEAAALAGMPIESVESAREAARRIRDLGPAAVLVKGGHLPDSPVDVFFDGKECVELRSERRPGPPVHGTGCVLSAAIAAYLARGLSITEAVTRSHSFVGEAIRSAFMVGRGHPVCGLPAHAAPERS